MLYGVNLLPPEVALRKAARRTTRLTVAAVLLVVALLGGLYTMRLGEITAAELARDDVQAEVARLQAEVNSLAEYRQLSDSHQARDTLLATTMAEEISFARVLNDLSLGFPAESSLRSLKLTVQRPEAAEGGISFGDAVAQLSFDGYSTHEYDPGVKSVLIEMDKMHAFFSSFLGAAAQEEIGDTEVIGFQGTVQLDEDAFTRRYADGLPEEVAK